MTRERGPLTVSVVTPVRNRPALIGSALRSALRQTCPPLEVIVVDDASTDETASIVGGFTDRRIHLLVLPRPVGGGLARNAGIEAAEGDLVAFLDSDDEWTPCKLERQLSRLKEMPDATMVYSPYVLYDHLLNRRVPHPGPLYEGDVFDQLLRGWAIVTSGIMVTRNGLRAVGGFDADLPGVQDYDLALRLAQAGHRLAAVPEVGVIKHEYAGPQVSRDVSAVVTAVERLDRKWRPVVRARLGPAGYRRWIRHCQAYVQYAHLMEAREAAARGQRRRVWRICESMWQTRPRIARHSLRALALALLGWRTYQILTRLKIPPGTEWRGVAPVPPDSQ